MSLIDIFSIIALVGGGVAIYYWAEIQNKTQRGSQAWLLLTITSVFLVTTPLFPFLTRNSGVDMEFMTTMLLFWGAVYMCFFAGAGYLLDRTFSLVPRGSVGKYLIEGFEFKKPLAGKSKGISEMLSTSGAIGFTQDDRLEDGVIETALDLIAEGRNVVLMSTMPSTEVYADYLKDEREKGHLRLVNVSTGNGSWDGPDAVNIAAGKLGDVIGILEDMPKGSGMIVAPVAEAYGDNLPSLEDLIERGIGRNIGVYGFIQKDDGILDDFFLTRLDIVNEALIPLKSRGVAAVEIGHYIDYGKHTLRGAF